jgi:RNA polymerase sigma factor (sigma-70 family)
MGTVMAVKRARSTTEQLHAALDGDRGAWDEIIDDYTNLLWWVARSHRLDDATAADVVQTVWLQLVQHGRSITNPERLPSWLATTARREAQRRLTVSKRQVSTAAIEDRPARNQPGPEELVLDHEVTAAALAAFQKMGSSCQRLLGLLCEVPVKSYGEIAALLDMPVGSIGPTRQRCLAELRAEIRKMGF